MSVIVEMPKTNPNEEPQLILFTKGADQIMFEMESE